MKVYEFLYCPCIYESAFATVSIHQTKKGAYNAMRNHKLEEYKQWLNMGSRFRRQFKFGANESWRLAEQNVLE